MGNSGAERGVCVSLASLFALDQWSKQSVNISLGFACK